MSVVVLSSSAAGSEYSSYLGPTAYYNDYSLSTEPDVLQQVRSTLQCNAPVTHTRGWIVHKLFKPEEKLQHGM